MTLAGLICLISCICIFYSIPCTAVKKWERNFDLSSGSNPEKGHLHNREQKSPESSKSRRTHRSSTIESFAAEEIKRFTEECLFSHNQYRKRHHVNPLELSKKLNSNSQKWADHLATINTFEHTPNNIYGENLYKFCRIQKMNGSDPVHFWYETEIPYFKFGSKNADYMITGHFSQIIWANSKYLGVGVARTSSGKTIYVVCQYDPPGNYIGEYDVNVLPIGGYIEKMN